MITLYEVESLLKILLLPLQSISLTTNHFRSRDTSYIDYIYNTSMVIILLYIIFFILV